MEELSELVLIIDFLLLGVSDGGFFVDFFQKLFGFSLGFLDFELEFLDGLVTGSLVLGDESIIFSLLVG